MHAHGDSDPAHAPVLVRSDGPFRRPLAVSRSAPIAAKPFHRNGRALPVARRHSSMKVKEGYEGIVVGVVMLMIALALIVGLKLLIG
jgi:hypothetical protein